MKTGQRERVYYLGIDNVIFANDIQELEEIFNNQKISLLKMVANETITQKRNKEEMVKKQKYLEEKVKEVRLKEQKTNVASTTQTEKDLQEVNTQIQEIDLLLKDIKEQELIITTEKLETFESVGQKRPAWDELLFYKQNKTESIYLTSAYENRLDVTRYYQSGTGVTLPGSACGPAAGAMVMDYYHDNRGLNIRDDAYYGSEANLINHMRSDMGTYLWGTTLVQFWSGAVQHIKETATSTWYASPVVNVGNDSYNNSLKYRNAINNGHPVGIRWDFWNLDGQGLRYHFVTGKGWKLTGLNHDNLMVVYKNPAGSGNDEDREFDWSDNVNDFEFVSLNFE